MRAADNLDMYYTVDPATGCWRWTGALDIGGYGRITVDGVRYQAHRYMYEVVHGRPIPQGYLLDHLCHTASRRTCPGGATCIHRRCINPAHMQPVTVKVNTRRGNAGKKRRTIRR